MITITTNRVPMMPERIPDRMASSPRRRSDLALLDDLERDRQRAGLQRQRQILGFLEGLSAEGNLAVATDPALDHRRAALDPAIEQDGHVIAHVLAGFFPELAPARPDPVQR